MRIEPKLGQKKQWCSEDIQSIFWASHLWSIYLSLRKISSKRLVLFPSGVVENRATQDTF